MSVTRVAVLNHSADSGLVFDLDVDRSGVIHSAGNAITGDRLIALMLAIVLRKHPETMIVSDARTSMALTQFITDRGGHHCLYRVGYRNVIDKGPQLNREGIEIHLMMETMGYGALKENHFLDDVLVVQVCYVAFWDEITLATQEADGKKINEDCMIARFSIWVDSKSQFRRDPLGVLEALLWRTNSILAISEHGARSSVYDEAKAVVHKNKATPEEVDRQMTQYLHDGFPDDKRFYGMKGNKRFTATRWSNGYKLHYE
ncbi:hypothetical protein GIB67_031454 [Kingdonia uniflora]|uniref:Alpha-D-phosphohexomutase alpha/beta/alpha domain-containing protein n=1 Tax=Kingdonia uniflora TaxID=39325 RepID=A0A7J7MBC8_9MAGN|nr:hypothetical protein GIB67_031454 [Kingdonia uniflora]